MATRWQRCRDFAEGSDAVKAGGYLPKPAGMSLADFGAYKERASFYNAVRRTVTALAGAITQREPSVTVPPRSETIAEDATQRGETLHEVARMAVTEILTVGRLGLAVDIGERSGEPYVAPYRAEDIVTWRTEARDGDPSVLTMVVVRENAEADADNPFDHEVVDQYREFALHEDGVYRVRVWRKSNPRHVQSIAETPYTPSEWWAPTRRGGQLDFIPFVFIGPNGTTSAIAPPPLLDLVDVTLAHYRNSADYEHGLHLVSLPTPWASGAEGDGDLLIGPSVCWRLGENGKAGMLEFSGEGVGAILDAMREKQKLMATLGARLLEEQPAVAETATAARMRHSGEAASLQSIAQAVSAGLTQSMRWAVWWQRGAVGDGVDRSVRVDLGGDFFQMDASHEVVRQALTALLADQISYSTFYHTLATGEWTRPGVTADEELGAIQRHM